MGICISLIIVNTIIMATVATIGPMELSERTESINESAATTIKPTAPINLLF